ncbi:hypothetical protein SynMITS9220M01_147 [Synechococcus phage SynMITS9220M01]|nr:hypothetical protein SynMITS9220M01_147 [Synechococcus phage SynMITS9220M01]
MINIFGEEEFKPIVRYCKEIPEYLVSKDAKVFSEKTNKFRSPSSVWRYSASGEKTLVKLKVDFDIPSGYYSDYSFRKRRETDSNELISIALHRVVMETWRPIDEYPPEQLEEEWFEVITPDMVGQPRIPPNTRQWVRDTALVDHKDDDPSNNHVDNLRWVIPKDNEPNRKKHDQGS